MDCFLCVGEFVIWFVEWSVLFLCCLCDGISDGFKWGWGSIVVVGLWLWFLSMLGMGVGGVFVSIVNCLIEVFFEVDVLVMDDVFIWVNLNVMELFVLVDLFCVVLFYMFWCVRYFNDFVLVGDFMFCVLVEYGWC